MDSPKTRQYISAIVGAGILLVFGAVVVLNAQESLLSENSNGLNINGVIIGGALRSPYL